jgi:uncharacterized protein (TIRG00374 family)
VPEGSSYNPGVKDAFQHPILITPLLLSTLIFLVGLLITFWRWHILVRAQGLPFSVFNATRLGFVGFFFSTFLPGSLIGGDVVKAAFIAREQSRRTVAAATVLADRVVGLWGLVWLVPLTGGVFWALGNPIISEDKNLQRIVLIAGAMVAGSLLLWLLLSILPARRAEIFAGRLRRIPKLGHILTELWQAFWLYHLDRRTILTTLCMSLVGHLCFVTSFYYSALVFQTPGEIPSFQEHFLLVPIGMIAKAGFPTPSGVGGGEYVFGWLYSLVGKPRAKGVLASVAQLLVNWAVSIGGYLVYRQMRPALKVVTPEPRGLAVAEAT